jgi:hypothetical protein
LGKNSRNFWENVKEFLGNHWVKFAGKAVCTCPESGKRQTLFRKDTGRGETQSGKRQSESTSDGLILIPELGTVKG